MAIAIAHCCCLDIAMAIVLDMGLAMDVASGIVSTWESNHENEYEDDP